MNHYKLIIAYDGTDYCGWQQQKEKVAVAQVLADSFRDAFKQEISFVGASRTDAGVHALGQVVRIKTSMLIDADKMKWVLNGALPNDVVIRSIERTDGTFHPFYGVTQKTYWYHFSLERLLPHLHRYAWYFRYPIDMQKLEECLQVFVGTHDFSAFSSTIGDKDPVRRIDSIKLVYLRRFKMYRIEVKGKSFLHFMIRRIVGACLTVASRDTLSVDYLKNILVQKNPEHELPKASARGLCLYKIRYKSE